MSNDQKLPSNASNPIHKAKMDASPKKGKRKLSKKSILRQYGTEMTPEQRKFWEDVYKND